MKDNLETQAVAMRPFEDDNSITRVGVINWRLLSLLRATGKATVLDALLREFAGSFDPPNMENAKPYACDFQSLRDRALAAFGTDQ